jgi:pSer/pThr/pTyr-binding forkhead associated (FHA) protein
MPFTLLSDNWLWLAFAGAAALAVGFFLFQRKPRERRLEEPTARISEVLTYLIVHDGQSTRCPVEKSPFRIGREPGSSLVLNDSSVSRRHAEITHNRDGVYSIQDLDSLNGVFVNDKRVKTAVLSEGCQIDIGDIRLTFTQLKTKAPPLAPNATSKQKGHR